MIFYVCFFYILMSSITQCFSMVLLMLLLQRGFKKGFPALLMNNRTHYSC